jgi:hypothetical protein
VKKYLTLIVSMLFVLGFAASAFAIHAEIPAETQATVAKGATQITLGGDIRIRGEFQQNTSDFNDDKVDRKAFIDQRIRLNVEAAVTPNTTGYIQIEGAGGPAANNIGGSSVYIWGNPGPDQINTGVYHEGENKRGTLALLQAWILHTGSGLLGIPAGFKVGHMPLSLGNALFFDHTLFGDDAIVFFADPTKELHVALLTAKFREGDPVLNDDADAYVGLFNYRTKMFGVSGDVTYVDDQNRFGQAPPALGAALPAQNGVSAHLWNFGLRGDVNVSGLTLRADAEVQAGKVTIPGADDVKFRGYAFLAGAAYTFAPVKVSVDYMYGSGPDPNDPSKFKMFVTAQSQTYYPQSVNTYVYNYRTITAAGSQFTGIANTADLKINLSADLTKDLYAMVEFDWLRAAKNNVVSLAGTHTLGTSKDIGVELDARFMYKVDRNLSYWVEGGYLFAGDFWKTSLTKDPDNAYAIRNGLQISF